MLSCSSGKRRYSSKGIARVEAKSIRRRSGGLRLRPYACEECGEYHLTSRGAGELEAGGECSFCKVPIVWVQLTSGGRVAASAEVIEPERRVLPPGALIVWPDGLAIVLVNARRKEFVPGTRELWRDWLEDGARFRLAHGPKFCR